MGLKLLNVGAKWHSPTRLRARDGRQGHDPLALEKRASGTEPLAQLRSQGLTQEAPSTYSPRTIHCRPGCTPRPRGGPCASRMSPGSSSQRGRVLSRPRPPAALRPSWHSHTGSGLRALPSTSFWSASASGKPSLTIPSPIAALPATPLSRSAHACGADSVRGGQGAHPGPQVPSSKAATV